MYSAAVSLILIDPALDPCLAVAAAAYRNVRALLEGRNVADLVSVPSYSRALSGSLERLAADTDRFAGRCGLALAAPAAGLDGPAMLSQAHAEIHQCPSRPGRWRCRRVHGLEKMGLCRRGDRSRCRSVRGSVTRILLGRLEQGHLRTRGLASGSNRVKVRLPSLPIG